jgi:acylphosphatase
MSTRRYLVRGRVQGVGFRHFVLTRATALGLGGWTGNLPDGRVEVVASGDDRSLAELEGLLQEGPTHAQVSDVEKSVVSDELEVPKPFIVKYLR